MVVDPPGTLVKVSLLCFLAGVGWAILAALIVYIGSTRIEPRVHASRIWADWMLHRMIWAFAVVVPLVAAYLTADAICRNIGMRDLYWWVAQPADLFAICRLGGLSGHLLTTCILVFLSRRYLRRPNIPDTSSQIRRKK